MKSKNNEIDMCNGPLLGKLLLFSFPLMLSGMLQLLFNAVDIIVVGQFSGKESLAAVGSTTSLINLMTNVFVGLSVGANVSTAYYIGSNQKSKISKVVHTSFILSVVSGIVLSVFGVIFSKTFLTMMDSPPDVIDLAALYLKIYFLGMPAVMAYNFGSAILRAKGDTKRPLYFLFAAGVINAILNLIFVIVFKWGVAGVAISTVISQYVSAILVIICFIKESGEFKLSLAELKFDKEIFFRIIKIGLPAGLQGTVFSFSNVVVQSSINKFGSTIISGNAAASSLEGFVYVAMNAFHQTAITFTGQNYGAKKMQRVDKICAWCMGLVLVVGLLLGNIMTLFGGKLLWFYNTHPEVIAAGVTRMKYICSLYALCGMMDVMVGMLRGLGSAIVPMIVSVVGACGLRLLWIATIFKADPQIEILYLAYPLTWAVTLTAHIICYIFVRRKAMKRLRII